MQSKFSHAALRQFLLSPASPEPTRSRRKIRKTPARISRSCRRPYIWTCTLGRPRILNMFQCCSTCLLQLRLALKAVPSYFCESKHLAHCGRAETLIPLPHTASSCKVACFSPPTPRRACLGPAYHVTHLRGVHQVNAKLIILMSPKTIDIDCKAHEQECFMP